MEKQIKGILCRSAEIEILMLNPYTLSMTIKGFHIREQDDSSDFITIDGSEGGTGAAPVELTNSVWVNHQA